MAKAKNVWVTYHCPANSAAYCRHHGWQLSVRQIRAKGCLRKKNTGLPCRHLKIYPNHPWWAERMAKKNQKAALRRTK